MNFFAIPPVRTVAPLAGLLTACVGLTPHAHAHTTGRNFELRVTDDTGTPTLVAAGLNFSESSNPAGTVIDPSGDRPYVNAIHDHFDNFSVTGGGARATFPSINTFTQDGTAALSGTALYLDVLGGFKFVAPRVNRLETADGIVAGAAIGTQDAAGNLVAPDAAGNLIATDLDLATENIFVTFSGGQIGTSLTEDSRELLLTSNFTNGANDFEFTFDIGLIPLDTVYVLETVLRTDAEGVADSDSVYFIFSPDGVGPDERLHFESLAIERQLGLTVPEPTTAAAIGVGGLTLLGRRRRR